MSSCSDIKHRAENARRIAARWREETGIYTGYVMVYQGRFFRFYEELPDYGTRRNCPCAVDITDNVFVVVGRERRWENIFESLRGSEEEIKEHIAIVAESELRFCFPTFAKEIAVWFQKSKTDLSSKKWKRLELITLKQIFDCMYRGISIDRVLNGVKVS
jgi:hypothetical protein